MLCNFGGAARENGGKQLRHALVRVRACFKKAYPAKSSTRVGNSICISVENNSSGMDIISLVVKGW